jgi:hypothetical protein
MSRNGTGTYNLPAGNPVVTGTTISSTWANNTLSDMATALSGSIAADGQTPITGALIGSTDTVTFGGTGQIQIPNGTTAQRSSTPLSGMIRYNSSFGVFEGYTASGWGQVGGGATGGGGDQVFVENARVVTTNYTLTTGKSAESVGPITINSGVTVTIPSDQRWVVL